MAVERTRIRRMIRMKASFTFWFLLNPSSSHLQYSVPQQQIALNTI